MTTINTRYMTKIMITIKKKLRKLLQEGEGVDPRVSALKAHMKLLRGHQEAGPAVEKILKLKIV